MAIADMFLKLQGVTGEAGDADHKGEIEVVSWSWGMEGSQTTAIGDEGVRRSSVRELEVVKRADLASPTLMYYLVSNKAAGQAKLTVRKAGKTPVEYFTIVLKEVRVASINLESQAADLVERVRLAFSKVVVTYTPQDSKGGPGAANTFQFDLGD